MLAAKEWKQREHRPMLGRRGKHKGEDKIHGASSQKWTAASAKEEGNGRGKSKERVKAEIVKKPRFVGKINKKRHVSVKNWLALCI